MSALFLLSNFINIDKNATFFHLTEFVVDGSAEKSHRGRQIHIGIHQRRNVDAMGTHKLVEPLVIFLKIIAGEERIGLCRAIGVAERLNGGDQRVGVGKIMVQKVEQHIAAFAVVGRIHRHFAKQILCLGMEHSERTQAVP